jgi:hypothetical protein
MHILHNDSYKKFYPATALFSYPSVLKDMSRIVDMTGKLDEYRYSPSEASADEEALTRDYKIALNDIAKAENDQRRKQQVHSRTT